MLELRTEPRLRTDLMKLEVLSTSVRLRAPRLPRPTLASS